MKRTAILILLALACSYSSFGQNVFTHFGVEGGIALNKFTDIKDIKESGLTGWHAGVSVLTKLPGFFAVQPAVEFERSRTSLILENGSPKEMDIDAINVPIAVQWGPDLGICRLFIEAAPYFGFNLGGKFEKDDNWENIKDYLKTTQFGIGAGGGVGIWRVQLRVRYNWAFGNWETISSDNEMNDLVGKKKGLTLSLAFFFN